MPGQMKAILPKDPDVDAVMRVLREEFAKYAPFLVKDFERTTTNWKGDRPSFTPVVKVLGGREMVLQIRLAGPDAGRKKWRWLNDGTKPHTIRPKGRWPLRFQANYVAGSKPDSTFTTRSGASGPEVRARKVRHPGTAPRNWSRIIVREHQRPFERWMQAAMARAADASGHRIK